MDEQKTVKKSSTAILCELTRLKSQQKYLECSQVKLNPDNFCDEDGDCAIQTAIREIEDLKITLATELDKEKMSAKRDVENMWIFVNTIRDDVFDPERLKQFTVQSIRERILSVNSMLSKISEKNQQTLEEAQRLCQDIEKDTKIILR